LARVGKAWNQKVEDWQSIRKETGKKILCEETRGKSQELAVGKLIPLHTIIRSSLQVSNGGKSNQQDFSLT
jgi:hypothetical protein